MSDSELGTRNCPNPTCEFDRHHPKANFCVLCGTLLFKRCDNCLDVNPRYAKFCQFCGSNLEEVRDTAAPPPPDAAEPPAEQPREESEKKE